MAKLVTGIFDSKSSAMAADEELIKQGFIQEEISLLMPESLHGKDFLIMESTKMHEGVAIGGLIGGIFGAVILGMAFFAMLMNGTGTAAAAQWISVLAGFGAGALLGGVIGGLVGMRMPEHEAKLTGTPVENTGLLLGVCAKDEMVDTAKRVLESSGAKCCSTTQST